MTKTFNEAFNELTIEDQEKVKKVLKDFGISMEEAEKLFDFSIKLEGENFHSKVPTDFAKSLWKLQQAYYRMVAALRYGDPQAALTQEEREQFKLVFKISEGSTESQVDLYGQLSQLLPAAIEKMEPWQIILVLVLMALFYTGYKLYDRKKEHEEKISQSEVFKEIFKGHNETIKEIIHTAKEAGSEGRMAILKGVSGVSSAKIGSEKYTSEQIEIIRKRKPRAALESQVSILHVAVEKIDAENKDRLKVTLKEKNSDTTFSADISFEEDEDSDFTQALNIIWDSARYKDRYFWAEISKITRRDKLIGATVYAVADTKDELEE